MIRKIGVGLIGASFLVSLNPYALLFVAPAFLVGVLLVWISPSGVLPKLLWTFLPLVLWYPAFIVFMYVYGKLAFALAKKLDFNFTDGFEGKAIVIEKMPCGQPIQLVDGREQLYIPANGVLLYQGELKGGSVNHRYFRPTATHGKCALPPRFAYMYFEGEKPHPNPHTVGAWLTSMGSASLSDPTSTFTYSFMEVLVSSKDSLETYAAYPYEKRFNAQVDNLVRRCHPAR